MSGKLHSIHLNYFSFYNIYNIYNIAFFFTSRFLIYFTFPLNFLEWIFKKLFQEIKKFRSIINNFVIIKLILI